MKTELPRPLLKVWHMFTEVPGWPDAPARVRVWRLFPLALPCFMVAGLLCWRWFVHETEVARTRAYFGDVIALQDELSALRLACSEQEAADLALAAAQARTLLAGGPDAAVARLEALRAASATLGWDLRFQTFDVDGGDGSVNDGVRFLPAVGKLDPAIPAPDALANLVRITELVFRDPIRMDLVRLQIRATDTGPGSVEMGLRIGTSVAHEEGTE